MTPEEFLAAPQVKVGDLVRYRAEFATDAWCEYLRTHDDDSGWPTDKPKFEPGEGQGIVDEVRLSGVFVRNAPTRVGLGLSGTYSCLVEWAEILSITSPPQ
jgi:hypothetical protein